MKGFIKSLETNKLFKEKTKPGTLGNATLFSSVRELEWEQLNTFSTNIILPIRGEEPYFVQGKHSCVKSHNYMVINSQQEASVQVRAQQNVEGLCFFLAPDLLQEVQSAHQQKLTTALQKPHQEIDLIEFPERIFNIRENNFGHFLDTIKQQFLQGNLHWLHDSDHFYYTLAEQFVAEQCSITNQLQQLPHQTTTTKQEIFHRLSLARTYILDCYTKPITLNEVARAALLSKYHVIRLYKMLFGTTPYQHILQLRLEKSQQLLLQGQTPTEVAHALHFTDRRAFSKAFRRAFGYPPSKHGQLATPPGFH